MTDARAIAQDARAAADVLARCGGAQRTAAIELLADELVARTNVIVEANGHDLAAAADLPAAMVDRLRLDAKRIAQIADGARAIARQSDPVGRTLHGEVRPGGWRLEKRAVPIGVVFFIYESRPNVTADAAALCLRSGNAVILRGGKEARHSNAAIADCVEAACKKAGLPRASAALVRNTDRALVPQFLGLGEFIDLAIPRGGASLIRATVDAATMPVLKHFDGNCHLFIDASADSQMATDIALNAKTSRPGVCNAIETLLLHADYPHATELLEKLAEAGVTLHADAAARQLHPNAIAATEEDWGREYLSLDLAVAVVPDVEAAIAHINRHGSRHTDAIVTQNMAAADAFLAGVDAASVMLNASPRFADGGQYGLGAEIGISTDKLHARGPMGAADLCTSKWIVTGNGHVRE